MNGLSPYLNALAYPVKLPYVSCIGQKLYLGNRFADKLTKNQSTFLLNCDGSHSFMQVLKQYGIEVPEIIHLTKYLLWWPCPVNDYLNNFDQCNRLILCTGPEIPWLGMGGILLSADEEVRTTMLRCFTTPAANHALYRGKWDYTLACKDESIFASRVTGAAHVSWNISTNHIASNFADFRDMLHNFIAATGATEIYAPAALGNEEGAKAIRDALVELVAEGYVAQQVFFYEDSPSCLGYRAIDEFYSAFEDSYLWPTEYYADTSAVSGLKSVLLDVFRSSVSNQQRNMWMKSGIKNAQVSGNSHWSSAERCWELSFAKFI